MRKELERKGKDYKRWNMKMKLETLKKFHTSQSGMSAEHHRVLGIAKRDFARILRKEKATMVNSSGELTELGKTFFVEEDLPFIHDLCGEVPLETKRPSPLGSGSCDFFDVVMCKHLLK